MSLKVEQACVHTLKDKLIGIMSSPFGSLMVNIAQSSGSSAAAVMRRGVWTAWRLD